MIAVKNERIWEEISAFGEPYPPFDFNSGMDVRDIRREEAITLGLWTEQDRIYPAYRSFEQDAAATSPSASDEFKVRLASKLSKNLDKLEADEERRLLDNEHADEYALLKNPKIGVKRRLDVPKKPASGIDKNEEIIRQCIEVIRSEQRASVPLLQRRLHLGYTDATRIMDKLESRGIVGPNKGAEPRDIL